MAYCFDIHGVQPFGIIPIVKCKGCGITLQYDDPNALGYTPKKESEYCQRCFRLRHYGDQMISLKQGIDPNTVISTIADSDGIIAWIVDLLDFDFGFIDDFNHVFFGKTIILIVTKSDLVAGVIDADKLYGFIMARLRVKKIVIDGLIVTGSYGYAQYQDVKDELFRIANGQTIIFAGKANAGKSTLINGLLDQDLLTTSRYPGTTIAFNPITLSNGLTIMDTPGIENTGSMLLSVDDGTIKQLLPTKPIKPKVFQVYSNQSYALGGLVRLDLEPVDHASIVIYMENNLKIHRTPLVNADALWTNHKGSLLSPIAHGKYISYGISNGIDGCDIVIHGLGWISIHGNYQSITLRLPEHVDYTIRQRMI